MNLDPRASRTGTARTRSDERCASPIEDRTVPSNGAMARIAQRRRTGLGQAARLLVLAVLTVLGALIAGHGKALAATDGSDALDAVGLIASLDPTPAYWDCSLPPALDHDAFEVDVADLDFDDDDLREGRSWSTATQLDRLVALIRARSPHSPARTERADADRDPSRFAASRGQPRGPPSIGA